MAELPEIVKLAGQMKDTLRGKTIQSITLLQEKCANIPSDEFQRRVTGARIKDIWNKGKWIITSLHNDENILLSLGMGADILYFDNEKNQSDKYQVKLLFSDGSGYTARFWWFGKFLLVSDDELASEPNTKDIAIDPFDERFTFDYFSSLLKGRKTQIKAFLMNQKNVSGIGNMYMHDILFNARLHPKMKISDMNEDDIKRLYNSIKDILNLSREKGTFAYESDFFGQKGGYTTDYFLVGYKENQPCPACGETIVSIKTGSTASYICPACQKIQNKMQ
ncbi:MAG: Fpg/Nei family DNA glycosylase [Clostridiaceae bacterium]|nr:Fpg/Nei family DNA glycosylase [Clostridiaceae bacterium]